MITPLLLIMLHLQKELLARRNSILHFSLPQISAISLKGNYLFLQVNKIKYSFMDWKSNLELSCFWSIPHLWEGLRRADWSSLMLLEL